MDAFDVVKQVAQRVGVPTTHIGQLMGKTSTYVANGSARGSSPQCNTMAAMLDVCGWSLVAMPSDAVPPGALVIDPPEIG